MSVLKMRDEDIRHTRRLLKRLCQGSIGTVERTGDGKVTVPAVSGGILKFPEHILDHALSNGLVSLSPGEAVRITLAGRQWLDQQLKGSAEQTDPKPGSSVNGPDVQRMATHQPKKEYSAESPLDQLARRKTRNGKSFLATEEFDAGERLRVDFEKARLRHAMGVNWETAMGSHRSGNTCGGLEELTAASLDARRRIDRALAVLGPELAGLLLDVCCFLKGLEQVEFERSWPRRSAKVVLRTGLAILARHYGLTPQADRKSTPVLHWGAEDYRPNILAGE